MPRETTTLPFSRAPHTAALAYLASLAHPDSTDDRNAFIDAGHAWLIRQMPEGEQKAAWTAAVPSVRPRDIESRWLRGIKRIETRRRLAAIELQTELLRANKRGRRDRLAALARSAARNTDTRNSYARIWRESLPVVHMAFALCCGSALERHRREKPAPAPATGQNLREQIRLENLLKRANRTPTFNLTFVLRHESAWTVAPRALLLDPSWVPVALEEAEALRVLLVQSGVVSEAETVRLIAG